MDTTLQKVEEDILASRFPITAAILKSIDNIEIDTVVSWLKWYNRGKIIFAQTGYEQGFSDIEVGKMKTTNLAESIIMTHNSVLEDVQKPNFGKDI